jgi:hypothetical protein
MRLYPYHPDLFRRRVQLESLYQKYILGYHEIRECLIFSRNSPSINHGLKKIIPLSRISRFKTRTTFGTTDLYSNQKSNNHLTEKIAWHLPSLVKPRTTFFFRSLTQQLAHQNADQAKYIFLFLHQTKVWILNLQIVARVPFGKRGICFLQL